VSPT
jgi:uncharacterized protein YukE